MRAVLASLLLPGLAFACGQSTHVWVSLQAAPALPAGPLRDLLNDPDSYDAFVSGTMFPDGGYAIGDDYGEQAHWPPLQQAYLRWIRTNYGDDLLGAEARRHVAFLMGLSSHGLSDELYDSQIFERSRQEDPGHDEAVTNFDTATDVLFIHEVGPPREPESWIPAEVLSAIYRDALGYEVSPETLREGQTRLHAALIFVAWAADNDERIQTMGAEFPWATPKLLDPMEPGSPYHQIDAVAAYLQDQWARLHDDAWQPPVIQVAPADGAWSHPRAADRVESRLHVAFSREVRSASLDAVRVLDGAGDEVAVDRRLFYGDATHTLVLRPLQDWAEDACYAVEVAPGLQDQDGLIAEGSFGSTFCTGREPVTVPGEPDGPERGCGGGGAAWLIALAWRRRRC